MRRLILSALLVTASIALAGCNHRPLYGTGGVAAADVSGISVEEQKTRAGQLIRNELLLGFRGGDGDQPYALQMDVSESDQKISSMAFEKTERHRYKLTANYKIVARANGEVVNKGESFSNVSYDTVEEPVADLRAAENARERAARELAQDIKLRVAAYLAAQGS